MVIQTQFRSTLKGHSSSKMTYRRIIWCCCWACTWSWFLPLVNPVSTSILSQKLIQKSILNKHPAHKTLKNLLLRDPSCNRGISCRILLAMVGVLLFISELRNNYRVWNRKVTIWISLLKEHPGYYFENWFMGSTANVGGQLGGYYSLLETNVRRVSLHFFRLTRKNLKVTDLCVSPTIIPI